MGELVRANLRYHSRRYVATVLAVAIAVAFVAASLVFGGALNRGIREQVAGEYTGAAAVIASDSETVVADDKQSAPADMMAVLEAVGQIPGVAETYPTAWESFQRDGNSASWIPVGILGGDRLRTPALEEGALPAGAGEAAATGAAAKRLDLSIGSTVILRDYEGQRIELTITGITQSTRQSATFGSEDLLVTPEAMVAMVPLWQPQEILVALESSDPGIAQQEELVASIEAALSDASISGVSVETGASAVDAALEMINTSQAALTMMLLLFPVIAAVVAMIVVGTTFQVIFRQRERELALLRVIGATGKQVRRLMILESVAVGLAGSIAGAAVGIFGGAAIASAIGVVSSYAVALGSVSPLQIGIVVLLGTMLTMLAGYRPARRASSVPPVTALAGGVQTVAQMSRKQKSIGLAAGVLTLALGAYTAYLAVATPEGDKMDRFPLVLLGAVLTVAALITFLSAVLPLITRALGRLGRSESYRLAGANTARNPGRTAATGVAVFIGVALISMVTLGAQSLRVTSTAMLDETAPIDVVVWAPSAGFTESDLRALENLDGVEASVVLNGAQATLNAPGAEPMEAVLVGMEGIGPVLRGQQPDLQDNQVLVPSGAFEEWSEGEAREVEVCVADHCETLQGVPSDALSGGSRLMVTTQTAQSFGALQPSQVWLKLSDPDDYPEVVATIQELGPELQVEGAAAMRSAIDQIVNILVMVVVGLLAVSVLVALVGITNTLSLSVAERVRENGLLRALGMTRKQVRSMLSWEALLIAVTATVVGLGAGAYFGIIGFMSLPLGIGSYLISVPWNQWAAVVIVAIAAALAASIIPGRKAARVSPVKALASE